MKKIISSLAVGLLALSMSGCATHAQTAALAGAVVGAAVVSNMQRPVYNYYEIKRPIRCYVTQELIGYTAWGRPIFQHRQVCR
jgi:outer membrane lipoprotein SlyB